MIIRLSQSFNLASGFISVNHILKKIPNSGLHLL